GFFKIISEDSALRNNAFGNVMKRFAEHMEGSVRQTFLDGGRPERWQPSKKKKGKTLIKRGRLMKVYSKSGKDYILLGSNLAYARIHQYGGTIEHPGANKRVMNFRKIKSGKNKRKTLFAKLKAGKNGYMRGTYGKQVNIQPYRINIPARPYLPEKELLSEDWDWLRNEINDFITKVK
ncbi:MAG TPA: phage virion morphogenesis protein, partial [bacterium]|nr:phage virion morphogenesis protein [bacterium]